MHVWTDKDTEYLLAHKNDSVAELCKALDFSHSMISKKRIELGITKPRHKWTKEEDELIRNAPISKNKDLAIKIGVSTNAINKRRKKLGLSRSNISWTTQEIELIKKNAHKMTNEELLYYLPNQTVKTKHTISSLKEIKNKYGITGGKKNLKGKSYTKEELRYVKSPKYTTRQVAMHTGRTVEGIKKKRTQLRKEGVITW